MTAQEAKEIMKVANEQTMGNLYQQIENRAKDGSDRTYSKSKLTDAQIQELEEKGYAVSYSDPNSCHIVSWA